MKTLWVATRGSALALTQTGFVCQAITAASGLPCEPLVITTRGDVDMSARLVGRLDKGFFTAELEEALRTKKADLAVHSLKDLPTKPPEDLRVSSVFERESAADLLLVNKQHLGSLVLPSGARIGTSALRREALIRHFFPGAKVLPLRGNVPTRVEKLATGEYDAIVIAEAGLRRLSVDLSPFHAWRLAPDAWVPAPAQGVLAVEWHGERFDIAELVAKLRDHGTDTAAAIERRALSISEGGCASPFGAYAQNGQLFIGRDTAHGWRSAAMGLPPSDDAVKQHIAALESARAKETPHDELATHL
jgi:hydroxymethylbilane synthase